jgi:hypothetical protein
MVNKADQLVAMRLLIAALRPEVPADLTEKTPISKRLLLTLFPRRTNDDAKETITRRGVLAPVYTRTKEKE